MIGLIVARTQTNLIGLADTIPWRSKADMKRFKETTMNSVVVVGSKTWVSIPKGLPGRDVVVITRYPNNYPDVTATNNIAVVADIAASRNKDLWIIGGSEIYNEAINKLKIDVFDITTVNENILSVAPELNPKYWSFTPGSDYSITETVNPEDSRLIHRTYKLISDAS